jgi:hypothetical protein
MRRDQSDSECEQPRPVLRQNAIRAEGGAILSLCTVNGAAIDKKAPSRVARDTLGRTSSRLAGARIYYIRMDRSWSILSSAIVAMMQSAQARVRYDRAAGDRPSSPGWGSLLKPQVRAIVVVVTDVLGKQPLQMSFVHRNDVIE